LRSTVSIHLRPFERPREPGEPAVSVARLLQKVPRGARKDDEKAVKLLEEDDSARARPLLERALKRYPDYVDARNEYAVLLMKEDKLPEAEAELRHALEVDPEAVRPLLNLGLCLYRQSRHADAAAALERAGQLSPTSGRGYLLLGLVRVASGDDAQAEPAFVQAYKLAGKGVARAQYYLSRIYTRRGEHARAAVALETYLRDAPDDPSAEELQRTLERLRAAIARR